MTPRLAGGLLWGFLVVVAPSVAAAQTTPAPPKPASIRGRVTAADNGRPLRRAQISVLGLGTGVVERRTTSTNVRGEYELLDLPAGRYTISATRSGYLPWAYGRREADEPGKTLEVGEGANLEKIDLAMPRAGVIGGRVIDETGEPVPGVSVWIMRSDFYRGRRRLVPATSSVRSDDTGHYRAFGLQPGAYFVVAMLRETWVAGADKRQVFGYAPTFFPSAATAAEAQRVPLQSGKEVSNADIALVAMPAATISGTVTRADGTPLAASSVNLEQNITGPSAASFGTVASARAEPDGSWRLRDVAPGEYEVTVSTTNREGARETATATIIVNGVDLEGVSLVAEAPVIVAGTLLTEDGTPLPAGLARPRVVADPITPGRRPTQIGTADDNGLVSSSGAFSYKTMRGPAVVQVWSLPAGWAVKSVEISGRESVDNVIDIKSGPVLDGVKVVVTNRFPTLTGRITDDKGADAEGIVVLFPADEARWLGMSDNIRNARTDQTGLFRLTTVPPGDYLAVALETLQPSLASDPEFLATLKDRASRITVREGQASQLTLTVRK
jgi:Carboxypeptidase regulatory-like domain